MRQFTAAAAIVFIAAPTMVLAQSNGVAQPPTTNRGNTPPPQTSQRPSEPPGRVNNQGLENARTRVPDRPLGIPDFVDPPPFVSP